MFSYNKQGNITFNGEPYAASSLGSSEEGQRRAAQFAEWLNECLRKVQEGEQATQRPTTAKIITLQPGKHYRRIERRPGPDRWEVTRLGMGILFSSLSYGLVGV